jgi:hypothetical protein
MLAIIISVIALLIIGTVIYLYKSGKIEDKDGNFIPDVIEEKVEEVKQRAARVVEEVRDVATATKEVVKQSKDVVNAAKGNTTRKGRRPKAKSKPTE